MTASELQAWLIWLRAPGVGPARLRRALARFGSLSAALAAGSTGWRECELPAVAERWLQAPDLDRIDRDLRWLDGADHHLLTVDCEDYPPLLAAIPAAPAALFVHGNPTCLWQPQIAIVGSRHATAGGLANARSFASALVQAGLTITSGLAEGIDGAAHGAALDSGGASVAVLGTGVDRIYPRCHARLAERLIAHGALVSEFALGTPGQPENFPRRNRILSGLSLGTLVVEAGLQSGSLITARLAAEQGREVFAIPGSIHNPLARGCHRLLRMGAKLVETAEDVLEELEPLATQLGAELRARLNLDDAATTAASSPSTAPIRGRTQASRPSSDATELLTALGFDPVDFDTLLARSGLTAARISSMLTTLELDGVIALLPGNCYQRIHFGANAAP